MAYYSTHADLIGLTFGGCYNTPTWLIGDKSRPGYARPKTAPTLPRNFPSFFSAPATRWSHGNSAPSKKKRNTPAKPATGTPLARCPPAAPDFEFEGAPSSLVLRGWGFFPVFPGESTDGFSSAYLSRRFTRASLRLAVNVRV